MQLLLQKGETVIKNASELKVKESDRLKATSDGLEAMNIKHDMLDDGLIIYGQNNDVLYPKKLIRLEIIELQ